ncbi:Rha family transcriptional regulator [Pseudochelatococcus contaminans]|uniref:Phage regulator Rha-like protein n=1 Tax=Pseudochelatococcus contaminans TaxID=1538103 RepID=A0A7W5Z285_9HYPH|nr:Rha family transcriptional regulator [Pseudochelatococcus contaminans]MBB3808763.1 phage regulator Rha-like protein [Pseudochelatococcus contaminans]
MAAKANSTRTSVAHQTSDIDPNTLPDLYSIVITGPDSEVLTSGERHVFSRTDLYGKGTLVLLWRRPDLAKPGQELIFAQLKSDIPTGARFGGPTPPGVDDVIFAETISTKQQMSFKIAGLLAIHKWLGPLKRGQHVHEFVQQHVEAKKEPAAMIQNAPVQQNALSPFIGVGAGAGPLTMSSREIAELTEKRHDNVVRDIRALLDAVLPGWAKDSSVLRDQGISITYDNRGYISEIRLPKDLTITLVAGYDAPLRLKIIRRWLELEAAQPKAPAAPTTYLDALKALVASEEAKQIAEQRALTAERTKAEIGTRREATAMNTASQAVKKANKLEVELDRSQEYATVKRMSMLYHGQEFNWRLLKRASIEMGIPAIDVFDQNYGSVKAYHADVWQEAYALDIPGRDDVAA